MNTDQIAAEAWDEIYNANANRPQGIAIIKSVVEKAYQAGYMHGWTDQELGLKFQSRAAHASEKGAEKLVQELRNIVNCDFAGMRKDFGEYADSQFRQWAQNRAKSALSEYESQRPTPATASEKGCTCDTTGEICRPSHDCPVHGIGKPDSASTGDCITCGKEKAPNWTGECPECEQKAIERFAATPSGGGEWTVFDAEEDGWGIREGDKEIMSRLPKQQADRIADAHNTALRDKQKECDDAMDAHERKLASEYVALRDCGNDTKRVLGLLLEVYNEHMHFGWGYEELHDKIIDELNTANMLPVIAIDAAMLETGEQTKEKE